MLGKNISSTIIVSFIGSQFFPEISIHKNMYWLQYFNIINLFNNTEARK